MAELLFGTQDRVLKQFAKVLSRYEADHPGAQAAFYRQNSASIRIRIFDPSFAGLSRSERHRKVWAYLRKIPEDSLGDLSVLLLLAPEEAGTSFANMDFNHPLPSRL